MQRNAEHSSEGLSGTQVVPDFRCKTVVNHFMSLGICNRLLYGVVVVLRNFFNTLLVFFTCTGLFYDPCHT